ncbi:small ubiquitin-related modifier 2-like isoform X1 [Coffea eugenioides]|uniref:small ubiquitin-related modifier 2-like isoform X1 n=1 Tax=Coffea eugenioides TaxID=49369 RepID=UPI000F5C2C15|nr:small ubiquitin-related modifier 2-like isoform X1 [Coffea arabica]XP_027163816.1 small ubiquitin-related modifier 2-like isoform X1 [Coffea eugenioides]
MARGDSSRKRPLETSYETCSGKILLKVLGQDGKMMNLEVKRNKPMKNILLKYCDYKKFEYSAVNFLYLGRRVLVRSTPEELQNFFDFCSLCSLAWKMEILLKLWCM